MKLHEKVANEEKWRGTRIDVVVEGNWTTYKTHIMHYFQQLAIITPYAQVGEQQHVLRTPPRHYRSAAYQPYPTSRQMEFTFRSLSNAGRETVTRYARRSDQVRKFCFCFGPACLLL